jgi:hypothetical protein
MEQITAMALVWDLTGKQRISRNGHETIVGHRSEVDHAGMVVAGFTACIAP